MLCPTCGTRNPDTNRFCGNCGTALEITCPNCSSLNPPGMRFCGQCGYQLGVPSAGEAAPSIPLPLSERRLITVLFSDLVGYTTFAEGRDPEDVRAFLTSYFDQAREVIDRFGGVVEKFIGDAVMAVWGAIQANEDDPERAVRAALELVDAIAKLAADVGAPELALRVGVHTGEASVGPGANQMGMVAGDNVNIASRLQSAAMPGTVLVGEGTYLAASRAIVFEPAGEQTVKGKTVPVAAWRALRVVAERGGVGRTEQLEPPFVGRAEELRLLKDLLALVARDSRSRMVSILGETGIGKSRLVWEFIKYIDGLVEPIYWHEGRSPAYGEGVTFWAVSQMIRRRAGIALTDPPEVAHAALRSAVDLYFPEGAERDWVGPRLAAVLGLGQAPAGDRAELDAAVRSFFEAVSRTGTTVLVFEDLQWADPGLLDFVEELTDWWRDLPILIIALTRPELTDRRPTWGAGRQGMISLRLSPLTDQEMRALVTGTVPGLPEEAVTAIVARAAGTPLYAVELLRGLLVQGDLEEEEGHYRLVGDVRRMAIPESLQAVIGARLDRLDPSDRTLLQDAAVLGYSFTAAGLANIKKEGVSDLETHLDHLVKREMIEPVRDPRSSERGQYRFLQALTRDVALGRMSREAKRTRHVDVARYFESLVEPELAVVVASHYLEALDATPKGPEADELRAKAVASMAAAAGRAADVRAYEQVLTIGQQALALADSPALKAPFWEQMTSAATSLARRDESQLYGRLALDHYRSIGDRHGENRMVRMLGFAYLQEQQPTAAVHLLEGHLEGRPDLSSDPELAQAASLLARALLLIERDHEAIAAADRALAAAEVLELTPTIVDALVTKATALGHPGRLVEARLLLEGAIALADRLDIAHSAVRGRNNLAHIFGTSDPQATKRAVAEAYEIAKRTGDRAMAMIPAINLASWHVFSLDFEQMERLLSDPIVQNPPDQLLSGFTISRAQAAWMRGEAEASLALYEQALGLVAGEGDPLLVISREGVMAEMALVRGELEESFESAMELNRGGWNAVQSGLGPALWSLTLLGDRTRIPALVEVIAAYPRLLPRWSEFWEMIADPAVDPTTRPAAVFELVDAFEQSGLNQWAIIVLAAAAQFSSRADPHREEFVAAARQRCDDKRLAGVQGLLDRYVA